MAETDMEAAHQSSTVHSHESGEEQAKVSPSDEEKNLNKQAPTPPSAPAQPQKFPLEAYLTVVGGWIALFCSFGFLNAFGVFEAYYGTSGIIPPTSSSTISWIGSIQAFLILASNLLVGPLQDKYGPKPLMLSFAVLFSFSCMMTSLCHQWWQLFLAQGVLQGFALSLGFAPPMACVIVWFKQKSPIAVAIIVSGSSIGGVVWPIVTNALLNHVGFGWTWRAIGFIVLVLLLVATMLVSFPPSVGALPVSEKDTEASTSQKSKFIRLFVQPSGPKQPSRSFFYWDAFKIPAFTSYLVAFWFLYLGLFYTFFYLPSWATLYGLSQDMSFYSLSILNAASFFGRLGLPFFSFTIGPFNLLFICTIISALLVYCSLAVTSGAGVLIIGGFYGFWSGGAISMMAPGVAVLVQDKSRMGSAVGQLAGFVSIAALLGPPISGWIIAAYDSPFKGFNAAQGFSAAALTVGAIGMVSWRILLESSKIQKLAKEFKILT